MRRMLGASLALSLLGGTQALAGNDIEVMTYNQYLGADFTALATAATPQEFNDALLEILAQIAATNFPERAQRQAKQIAARLPDLVGLQEAWKLGCTPVRLQACDDPSIAGALSDHLTETLAALRDLRVRYRSVAIVKNLALESPGLPLDIDGDGVPDAILSVVDRDVILARTDTVTDVEPVDFGDSCPLPSEDGCNYLTAVPVSTPLGDLRFERGFVAVDLTVGGRDYRFVNTHFEVREPEPGNLFSRFVQFMQAHELIEVLEETAPSWPVIVVGDINSSPEDEPVLGSIIPPYRQFVDAGYTDIWTRRPGAVPGFTCCQDADLLNRHSALDERIDMIFSSEPPVQVKQARVLGANVADKTPPPGPRLWPSDHGAVAAGLRF